VPLAHRSVNSDLHAAPPARVPEVNVAGRQVQP
jgi:hypothetical protein